MPFPVIKVDSTNGLSSDSLASGAGPTTALTGSAGVTASDGSSNVGCRVTLDGSPDLTNVLTDGTHAIYYADATTGARNFAAIVAKGNSGTSSAFVDVNSVQFLGGATATNGTSKSWAIGGTRATVGGTNSFKLVSNNSAAGDAMPGWAIEMQSGHVETLAATYAMRRSGDQTNGHVIHRGAIGAATRPVLTWNLNGAAIQHSGNYCRTSNFDMRCSAATRTSSVALTVNVGSVISGMRVNAASPFNFNKALSITVGTGVTIYSCEFANCLADAISLTTAARLIDIYAHDNVGNAIAITGANAGGLIEESELVRNANGISDQRTGTTAGGGWTIQRNTIANNVADGIVVTANGTTVTTPFLGWMLRNNNLTGNGTGGTGYGLNLSGSPAQAALTGGSAIILGNNFGSGTTANATGACSLTTAIADTSNIAVDPAYTNAASDNFTVTASGAKGTGHPTANVGGGFSGTRSYITAGVAQPQATTATYTAASNVRNGTDRGDGTLGTLVVPAASTVLSTATFDNGTAGTYVGPATGTVQTGVTYGAASALTGTYDGSDRWADPGVSNVLIGVAYKANSTTNNRTGTVTLPVASNVLLGITYGAALGTTGTVTLPSTSDVRNGTTYGAALSLTGTLIVSGATYTDPGLANVKTGVTYTYNSTVLTGTYDGSDRWTDPGVSHVQSGTAYKANSVTNNRTGTYDPVTGNYTDVGVANVALGVTYKFGGSTLTGTLSGGGGGMTLGQLQGEMDARGLTAGFTSGQSGGVLVADKTGFILDPTGLDFVSTIESISSPPTYREISLYASSHIATNTIVRAFNPATKTGTIVTKKRDGTTWKTHPVTAQGDGNETRGAIS